MILILLAAGCALGPDYERPEIEEPVAFEQTIDDGASLANLEWWEVFQDPALQELIETALEQNDNLAIAAARVEEARARLGFVRADQFPQIDGRAGASRGNRADLIVPGAGINESYILAADLSWELDIWGKLRRSTEAARAELLATEDTRQTVIITLIADVASAYFLLRDLDARREIAAQTVVTREESVRINSARFEKGIAPLIDVNQAEILVADAAAEFYSIERQIVETENLLSVLLGRNPRSIVRGRSLADQPIPPAVPVGLPSELLNRRPDVRSAEQVLAAQTARIGVAEALRLPSLSLTGTLGRASDDISDLTNGNSKLWSVGGDLLGPIFDAGKTKSNVEVERARTEQALNQYELTILQAFSEVENALAGIRNFRDESAARTKQVAAAQSAAMLSQARYDGGVTSYLEVLDSDRSLFDAALAESATRRLQLVSIVELYKALGGGWVSN